MRMEIATSHNNLIDDWFNQRGIIVLHVRHASEYIPLSVSFKQQREKRLIESFRGCLHDTGTSFILVRVVNFIPRLHGRHRRLPDAILTNI